MDDSLRAVILGIIEGLTEFLPVSSTGHMILAMPCLGIDGQTAPWPTFLYFIQTGAILAVVIFFFRTLLRQTLTKPPRGIGEHLFVKLLVAMVPAAVIGLPLDDIMEKHLEKPVPVALALIIGGGLMVLIERNCRRTISSRVEDISLRQAFLVGLAQCVAIIPGTSRSMATIMGGLAVGLPGAVAAEFSFYLAIPTLLGAGLVRIVKHRDALTGEHAQVMMIGFAVSFLVAWAVVAAFMRYIQTKPLWPFAVYRVVLGIVVLIWTAGAFR
ncbi:MAG: undecaprenyl-diphosphatase [Planctomycetota bacterium]|nr:MAG: undecaprenyl-diphosphatase [Planctomycetota bacterium]